MSAMDLLHASVGVQTVVRAGVATDAVRFISARKGAAACANWNALEQGKDSRKAARVQRSTASSVFLCVSWSMCSALSIPIHD